MSNTCDEEVLLEKDVCATKGATKGMEEDNSLPFVWPHPVDTRLYCIMHVKENEIKTGDIVMLKLDEPSTEFGGGYLVSKNKDGSYATYWDKAVHVASFVESVERAHFVVKKIEPEQIKNSMIVIQRPKVALAQEKSNTSTIAAVSSDGSAGKKRVVKALAEDDACVVKRKKTTLKIEFYGLGVVKSNHHKEVLRLAGVALGVNLKPHLMSCGTMRVAYVPAEGSSDTPRILESAHQILEKINSCLAQKNKDDFNVLDYLMSPQHVQMFKNVADYLKSVSSSKAASSSSAPLDAIEYDKDVHCVDDEEDE